MFDTQNVSSRLLIRLWKETSTYDIPPLCVIVSLVCKNIIYDIIVVHSSEALGNFHEYQTCYRFTNVNSTVQ